MRASGRRSAPPGVTDAGDDLGSHPGRVRDHLAGVQHIAEAVLADRHEQGCAEPARLCVRSPALFCLTSRSSPMTAATAAGVHGTGSANDLATRLSELPGVRAVTAEDANTTIG